MDRTLALSVAGGSLTTSRDGAFEVNGIKWWLVDSPWCNARGGKGRDLQEAVNADKESPAKLGAWNVFESASGIKECIGLIGVDATKVRV